MPTSCELRQEFVPEKLRGKMIVRGGQSHFEIARVAREIKADLIVLNESFAKRPVRC
jgi:hypothetical protein